MAEIKSAARSSAKWKRQSAAAQPEYKSGVELTKKDWEKNTLDAASNYDAGVQAGIAEKRFQGGVAKAGTGKWREKTLMKGPQRWAEGISQSTDAYEKGFAPYRSAIEAINLPPRGPKGSAQNIQRVAVIAARLHEVKKQLKK